MWKMKQIKIELTILEEEVAWEISQLPNDKAPGIDNIPAELLKEKAFDCIDHDKLWKALEDLGVPTHLVRLLQSLYTNQQAAVRTTFGDLAWFKIEKGVQQGCFLSPFLFNLYSEVMRKMDLEESKVGIKIRGRAINNLQYTDGTTLLSETQEGLKQLIHRIKEESERFGLLLNIKKRTLTAAQNEVIKIAVDNVEIECVGEFTFLGSLIACKGECSPEIK
ncbi:hypothetical protein EYD10_13680 [Varanus komodoensis]|nr:hypothetical protein EYD10_13680 [Varanus komodoensis]